MVVPGCLQPANFWTYILALLLVGRAYIDVLRMLNHTKAHEMRMSILIARLTSITAAL